MKKVLLIIGAVILAGMGWLFSAKPTPPFGAVITPAPQGPTYFAEIDANGNVIRVLVISQENLNTGLWGDPKNFVQTYPDSSKRKHYAGQGFTYDKTADEFIPPKPFNSWILNKQIADWEAPVKMPKDKSGINYKWDESTLSWKLK